MLITGNRSVYALCVCHCKGLIGRQRKLIAPAFTAPAVRALTPIFFQKAEELKDRWTSIIAQGDEGDVAVAEAAVDVDQDICDDSTSASASAVINVAHWVSRATFDVVGLAGFDYHFRSLRGESEELYVAYRRMFNVIEKGLSFRGVLQLFSPLLEKIWASFIYLSFAVSV